MLDPHQTQQVELKRAPRREQMGLALARKNRTALQGCDVSSRIRRKVPQPEPAWGNPPLEAAPQAGFKVQHPPHEGVTRYPHMGSFPMAKLGSHPCIRKEESTS